MPGTAAQVMQLCQQEDTDAAKLSAVIHGDPTIASNVLRVANSVAYMGQAPCSSLQQAVSRLGMQAITEIAVVGPSEKELVEADRKVLVGRARFSELARGQISGSQDGLLKIVVDADSLQILGCQILGEGATEPVHLAQVAMINQNDVRLFVDNIFNFPTLAEAYRVAALDIVGQVAARQAEVAQPS